MIYRLPAGLPFEKHWIRRYCMQRFQIMLTILKMLTSKEANLKRYNGTTCCALDTSTSYTEPGLSDRSGLEARISGVSIFLCSR